MKCPECGAEYVCPCDSCTDFRGYKSEWKSFHDDTEACPSGHRKHVDTWFEIAWEQHKQEKDNKK